MYVFEFDLKCSIGSENFNRNLRDIYTLLNDTFTL